jgi:D-alanine-D-alanine ligase
LARTIFDQLPEDYWHICSYDLKFGKTSLYEQYLVTQIPPKNVNYKLLKLITEIALDTYNILDCHDYGLVDIKLDRDDNPYILELNPNPPINKGNRLPIAAELIGLNYGDLLEEIIALTIKRYKNKPPYYHLQPNLG